MAGRVGRSGARGRAAVAVLFADICGSTQLFSRYGDVRARRIEARVLDVLAGRIAARGGKVIKTVGDEIMGRFAEVEPAVRAACEMHQAVKDDAELEPLHIAVRIGLHHGPVLVEGDDVFGDAVNVAARMVSLAKADQTITTRETVERLPAEVGRMARALGRLWVRGKQEELEICEVIWRNFDSLTQMPRGSHEEWCRFLFARLVLSYRDLTMELTADARAFTMGRGERNRLIVDRELVSRSHADIEFRQNKFVLIDHSTNGTYLLLENGARFLVRREEFTLHERRIICLGQPVLNEDPDLIRYQCF